MLDKLQGGRLQLAGGRHRGRRRPRARRRGQGASARTRCTASSSEVRAAGINVIGNYIFGLPEDDHDTMQATLDLALDLNCEFANFYSAMAYPGSPLYTLACARACRCRSKWTGYSQHSRDCLPLPTRYLPAREVLRFRDEAFRRYYTDPGYLEMVERRFGADVRERDPPHDDAPARPRPAHRSKLDVPPTLLPPDEATVGGWVGATRHPALTRGSLRTREWEEVHRAFERDREAGVVRGERECVGAQELVRRDDSQRLAPGREVDQGEYFRVNVVTHREPSVV